MKKLLLTILFGGTELTPTTAETLDTITVAGGCYWCVESDFEGVDGVKKAISGFAGGDVVNPTYKQVTRGGTGHYEAVQVTYDSDIISRVELYDFFFRSVDPLDAGGQFCDRGQSYQTAIFARPKDVADAQAAIKKAENALGKKVVTPILSADKFYATHNAHQDYYKKHPLKYGYYRKGCGRDARVKEIWGQSVQH